VERSSGFILRQALDEDIIIIPTLGPHPEPVEGCVAGFVRAKREAIDGNARVYSLAAEELQDFLDIYFQGMNVLREAEDFEALTLAYMDRAAADGIVHVEIFFDPQGHTQRGIPFAVATNGILSGLAEGGRRHGISSRLILCFLRHLSEEDGFATFREAEPWFADGRIIGVGLDSTERRNPPAKFAGLFQAAHDAGLKLVAHAGEEGSAANVRDAVDILKLDRIDHGNAALDDPALVERLAAARMALTVCPLSNVKLCVVPDIVAHPLKRMLDAGLCATVNSDDPSYFGGYLGDNFMAVTEALGLTRADLVTLARNSIEGSFLDAAQKAPHLARLDAVATSLRGA
jgi:adenosine deaminase